MTAQTTRIVLGGCEVDLVERAEALAEIDLRAGAVDGPPLAVVSVNLDHVHHFGSGARWHGALDAGSSTRLRWLNLIDGAPLASQAARITGASWPRLAGSDLAGAILDQAEHSDVSVGFLGGATETHNLLRAKLMAERPALRVSGYWDPSRADLEDLGRSGDLAREVAAAGTDILIVGLGKPRQELWIAENGITSGARVLLAFGAVVDFLADRVERSPEWIAGAGFEWAWRLSREPRRLAHRYLVDGPPAYLSVRRNSAPASAASASGVSSLRLPAGGGFAPADGRVDMAVVIVTFNSGDHLNDLLRGLRTESAGLRLRVIVVDNGSTDTTLDLLANEPDVIAIESGGNLGYAGGINAALRHVGDTDAVLVLNPDLTVEPGALRVLRERMIRSGAGVVVPRLLDSRGETYPSLRREPSIARAVGDALFGRPGAARPPWSSEADVDRESYLHAHRIDWATGAALLIHRDVATAIGSWDTRFFLYSEETDFFRRVRDAGYAIWYEPQARVRHEQGGSGSSTELQSLMAVNRVRYVSKHHRPPYASAYHAAVLLHEAVRSFDPAHRTAFRVLLDRRSWRRLPRSTRITETPLVSTGAIIIPAHNEASTIARTLRSIHPLLESGTVEIIVACNGCTDDTAAIARQFSGVRVLDLPDPSKTAALNAGDAAAASWPRLYLDADISISAAAVAETFEVLESGALLAARPAYRWDCTGASLLVRRYYRARGRMLQSSTALWGGGAYALSEAGHSRFGSFPSVTADDLFIDRAFAPHEKRVLATQGIIVRTPRTAKSLLTVLRRQVRGPAELGHGTSGSSARELFASARGAAAVLDALIYAGFAALSRIPHRSGTAWERDRSTRNAS